jgi:TonB-linked SusC/RagA family outer membrane protein
MGATMTMDRLPSFRTLGNIYGEYKILPRLILQSRLGVDFINYREHTYDPPTTRQGGKYNGLGLESNSEVYQTMLSNTLNYRFSLLENHSFDLVLGNSYEGYRRIRDYMRGQDFPSPELEYIYSAATIVFAEVRSLERKLNSYFGRLKYNYDNRYLFTFTARYDGSSRFGENNRYGFFPSGDFAWRISEEIFYPQNVVNDLKLRLSYGLTGNDQVPDFSTLPLYSTDDTYNGLPGISISQLPNPDLKWESTAQTNVGLDLQMFESRITMTLDYYYKNTTNLLLQRPIPTSSGFSGITNNIGSMENRGVEIYLQSLNLDGPLTWTTSMNLSFNRNKVTELYNDQPIEDIGRGYNRVEVGQPIGVFYGWNSLGVDPTTGDLVFEDIKVDGIIDENDRTIIGNPHPDFQGGFNSKLSYSGFELSLFMQFSYGNQVFNGSRRYIEVMKGIDNQTAAVLRRWKQEGDVTDVPRATNSDPNANDRQSSRFIEDGSYLKLKNIKLSYNLKPNLLRQLKMKRVTLYILGENLLTLTNYTGMDPEVNYAGQDVLRLGTEFFTYPQAKSFHVGINLGF